LGNDIRRCFTFYTAPNTISTLRNSEIKTLQLNVYFENIKPEVLGYRCAVATGQASAMAETHSLQDLQQPAVSSKVFVQRDYSSGTICKFQTKFPSELESRMDKQQFEETMQTLNNLYAEAEKLGGKSYLEGCLACLTAYTIFLCMETHYEKVLKKIAKYIKDQNEKIYAPRGLLLTDPIERGLRVVEITIFEDRNIGSGR
ncbi:PREDICTED: golgin subfamily A member 7-like, partial [Poecilia mexicana]